MLKYGNFKYAFKTLSGRTLEQIRQEFSDLEPIDIGHFSSRHSPLSEIQKIPREDTRYLGYLIQKDVKDKRKQAKSKKEKDEFQKENTKMNEAIKIGKANHERYLTYDHMDVYVATSMRIPFDFWNVSRFVDELFENQLLKDLHLRWFDPTQAYCEDRIDKGLVEGLMVRRASCTIYLAQESDTLGKDSELATTLAQGKPVIAYIREFKDFDQFTRTANEILREVYPGEDENKVAMQILQLYYPDGAWKEPKVRKWLERPDEVAFDEVLRLIFENAKKMYDKRAVTLKEYHPLGLQINLDTGVANGVIVVRSIPACAKVLRAVLLRELEFDIEETLGHPGAWLLRERLTNSVYRVVTKDKHLTNSFWNFYT